MQFKPSPIQFLLKLARAAFFYLLPLLAGCLGSAKGGHEIAKTPIISATTAPTFRYAGRVVDEQGHPIINVRVIATHQELDGSGCSYIDDVRTDSDGYFSIDRPRALSGLPAGVDFGMPIRLEFVHSDYEYGKREDMRLYDADEATHQKVVLHHGQSVQGIVTDPDGHPLVNAAVDATFGEQYMLRRAAVSDGEGHFQINGLPQLKGTVNVLSTQPDQPAFTAQQQAGPLGSNMGTIRTTVIPQPSADDIHQLFGLKLVDVTPAIRAAYHLERADGVMVLDPGTQSDRLQIGVLQAGDYFWMVGENEVKNFAEFRQRVLDETSHANHRSIRIVYSFRHGAESGSNTQYLQLNEVDVAELTATAP